MERIRWLRSTEQECHASQSSGREEEQLGQHRRGIAGIECGGRLAIEGTPVDGDRGLTLYNPAYDLL